MTDMTNEPIVTNKDPYPNEAVRVWVKRIRKIEPVVLEVLTEYQWPIVEILEFTKLTGVGDWLSKNVGEDDFIWSCSKFWFTKEADAVLFKLTWHQAN